MTDTADVIVNEAEDRLGIVDYRDTISSAEFGSTYVERNRPVVLTGMMEHWAARERWSPDYFEQIADDSRFRLDVGNVMQETTRLESSDLKSYIADLKASEGSGAEAKYLSNFDLFGRFPTLRDDVDVSLIRDNKRQVVVSGWIGPAGTFTGWHTDYADNILAQVWGTKIVDLVPPSFRRAMYPSRKFDRGATLSRIGKDSDLSSYPLHRFVRSERVVLKPGMMVFIPKGWWHRVRSVETSISVSYLGFAWGEEFLPSRNMARAKTALHLLKLYGRDCTCHLRP